MAGWAVGVGTDGWHPGLVWEPNWKSSRPPSRVHLQTAGWGIPWFGRFKPKGGILPIGKEGPKWSKQKYEKEKDGQVASGRNSPGWDWFSAWYKLHSPEILLVGLELVTFRLKMLSFEVRR